MKCEAFNRRQFLQSSAAVAIGALAVPRLSRALAAAGTGETDHFFYRLAPEGPYIDSQRDNKAFAFQGRPEHKLGHGRPADVARADGDYAICARR